MATPTRTSAGPTGFPDIPGIDRHRAERRLGGNRALFLLGLRDLRDEFADVVAHTRADLARDDLEGAIARLHTLRGIAGNLSAEELAALAGEIERGMREARRRPSERALARLDTALGRLLGGLPKDLEDVVAGESAGAAAEVNATDVEALIAALAQRNMDALDRFHALRPALAARHGAGPVDRLADAVDKLQFGVAAAQLRAWYASPTSGGAGA